MQWTQGDFILTDDRSRLNVDRTFVLLQGTYWGVRRPREVVAQMVEHSLCFALLKAEQQVGFVRAVTDFTVFTWIADLVVEAPYRGLGLGTWMMHCLASHPALLSTQKVLQTRDAHEFYEKFGLASHPALMSTPVPGL